MPELMFVLSGALIIVLAKPLARGFVRLQARSMKQQEGRPKSKWAEFYLMNDALKKQWDAAYKVDDVRKVSLVMRLCGGSLAAGGITLGIMKAWLKSS